ncbi:MAG: DUF2312 domain-containing protein [Ferrovibrionaceae bacterium]
MSKRKSITTAILDEVAEATPLAGAGHNAVAFSDEQLLALVERVERVEQEIKASNEAKKEIYAEARDSGFDVPALKKVVAERRIEPAKFQQRRAIEDLYRQRIAEAEAAE